MCYYTKYVPNPKFKPNKSNNFNPPKCTDKRLEMIPIKCGECKQCRKAKAREWAIRLNIERKANNNKAQFVTLTFSEEKLKKLTKAAGGREANIVATIAMRRFMNRWVQKHKKSVKHWFITELGHKGTERLHLHGIMFTDETKEEIEKRWGYGIVDVGYSMNEKVINYVTKYILKEDKDHKGFKGKIFPSPGIGSKWLEEDRSYNKFRGENTNDHMLTSNGAKVAMPTYYRRKQYKDDERESMWISKIEKGITYINGHKINTNTKKGEQAYAKALEWARYVSKREGYGSGQKEIKEYMVKNKIKKIVKNLEASEK